MPLLARAPPLHHSHPLHSATARLDPRSSSAGKPRRRVPASSRARVRASNSDPPQQQLNLSVLRFTLGIPGLDESYLPRWIGLGFGALVVLNHLLSPSPTPAQLRSEALGLCLAAFSATLPFLGRFLEVGRGLRIGVDPMGADAASRVPLPEGSRQVFVMSENMSAAQKEDVAWASYVLLRNTNTTSVLIAIGDLFCVRGYWDPPANTSKYAMIEWFKSQMQQVGLVDLRDTLYFPNSPDSQLVKILPDGVLSVLAQPVLRSPGLVNGETKTEGVILLASNANYAYTEKDRVWIRTVANKFQSA
ncbi:protein COFACTOR ASSEMBLY OF COMPLEX C SUBUNIT B CCB2, chloroplastic [Panicum miliaceum]|uniref:Protein COFACTOR ASSEMBLY OF COMPLEX C SUBUNIT B CCB2, chloroplastic n=1 Tax=Panicum miliaceum TaxID=4540 RepID=A0A3L6TNY1_PANMI|nr:protein COFACTOR ASSEMBLY OF COMPLEX C SUBUNIT B CCB2, chloroplastic [Panicum miliaceum]